MSTDVQAGGTQPRDEEMLTVAEERLLVTRRWVDSGSGVRLRKVVHSGEVTVDEPLAEEVIAVTRVAVGHEVTGPVAIRYEGNVTIVPVVREELVVVKKLILTEEIRIVRECRDRRSPQSVPVRTEEVIVERQDPTSGEWHEADAPRA